MYFTDLINFHNLEVSAGFPSPAGDIFSSKINIYDYLVINPSSTFCIKISGDSMQGAGIFSGDMLVIDKSIKPKNNQIILCMLNGDFLVKKIRIIEKKIFLISENPNYKTIPVTNINEFNIFGVIVATVKKFV